MDLNQPPPGKMPHLRGLGGKVALGLARGGRSRLWQFLGVLLLAAVLGGPARLAGGGYQETSPSAKVQNAWLTASVSVPGTTTPIPQTIRFAQPPNVTVGASVTLFAAASSELPVSFSSDTPPVCTVAGPTVTTLSAGTCTITASQGGNADYAAAPDVSRSFQVQAVAPPAITFAQPPDVTVGTSVTLSASVSPQDGLAVLFSSDTPSVCTVPDPAVPAVTTIAVGTCTITAYQHGDPPRAAPGVTRSFQVQAVAPPAITFAQPPDVTAGTSVTLSASVSPQDGLAVLFSSDTPSVCTVPDPAVPAVTTIAVGTCTITAYQHGDPPRAAPDVSRSFQVSPARAGSAAQTITFVQPPGGKAGARVTLSASASSGLPVSFSSGTPPVCTVVGRTVTTVAPGPCTITASQGGNARYAAAPDVSRSFQVSPARAGSAAQTITFVQPPGGKAGARVTLSASASSGLPVSFSSGTPPVCTVVGRTVTTVAPGPCTITASQGGNARYAAAPDVSRSFQVSPVTPGLAATRIIVLAAVILAATAAAVALVVRRRPWLHSHPPTAPALSVRAVPHTGPPRMVSVHATGTDATHTVRIEPSPGAGTTTIKEARP